MKDKVTKDLEYIEESVSTTINRCKFCNLPLEKGKCKNNCK